MLLRLTRSATTPGQHCCRESTAGLRRGHSTAVPDDQHCSLERPALLVGATRTAGLQHPHCCLCERALLVTATRVQVALSLWRRALTGVFHWLFLRSRLSTVPWLSLAPTMHVGYGIVDVTGVDHLSVLRTSRLERSLLQTMCRSACSWTC